MRDLADVVDDVKHRLKLQQRVVIAERTAERPLTEGDVLSIRAELDALWEAVAALLFAIEGVPAADITVHDYFAESGHLARKPAGMPVDNVAPDRTED